MDTSLEPAMAIWSRAPTAVEAAIQEARGRERRLRRAATVAVSAAVMSRRRIAPVLSKPECRHTLSLVDAIDQPASAADLSQQQRTTTQWDSMAGEFRPHVLSESDYVPSEGYEGGGGVCVVPPLLGYCTLNTD